MEKIDVENVDAREHPHQSTLHNQQHHHVNFQALGLRLQRIKSRGESDDSRHYEQREGDSIEA